MHNRYNFITQDNLKNIESFRLWLKENIAEIYEDKKIPDEHLLIFLTYIKRAVSNAKDIDNSFWLKLIRQLESWIDAIKNVEKKNEL